MQELKVIPEFYNELKQQLCFEEYLKPELAARVAIMSRFWRDDPLKLLAIAFRTKAPRPAEVALLPWGTCHVDV